MANIIEYNLWDRINLLSKDIITKIYEYDRTKKENFDNVIAQLRNTCILCKRQYSKYIIKDGATNYIEENECNMFKCTHSFCTQCYTELANRQFSECPICDFDISIITEVYYDHNSNIDTDSEYSLSSENEETTVSLIDEFSDTYDSEEDYNSDSDCYN